MNFEKLFKLPRSAKFLLGALAMMAPHLFVRCWTWRRFFAENSDLPFFLGSDSYYHAHRIGQIFDTFPLITFHDPFMAFPSGAIAQWPFGFDYPTAALLSLGKVAGLSWNEVVWALPFVGVFISAAVIVLFYRLISTYSAPLVSWLATFCFSMGLAFISVSHVGQLDHHVNETLGIVLLMLLPSLVSKDSSKKSCAIAGIALAMLVWSTTLLAFLVSIFFVIWLLVQMIAKESSPAPLLKWLFIPLAIGLTVFCTIESAARRELFSFGTLSMLHALAILLPLGGMFLLNKLRPLFIVLLLLSPVVLFVVIAPSAVGWILSFVLGHNSFISNVIEALPIFMTRQGPSFTLIHFYFGITYVLFPVMFLMLRRQKQLIDPSLAPAFWFMLVLFLISFSQKRFAHLFSPGLVFVTFLWAQELAGRVSKKSTAIIILAMAAGLLLEPLLFFGKDTGASPSKSTVQSVAVAKHIKELNLDPGVGVSAPPNMGNAINFVAKRPSTSNTFFYKKFLKTDMQIRDFKSTKELIEYLKNNNIGVLVATDDARYRTMLLDMFGRDLEAKRFSKIEFNPCSKTHLRFGFDRLACLNETPPGLKLTKTFIFENNSFSLLRRAVIYQVDLP